MSHSPFKAIRVAESPDTCCLVIWLNDIKAYDCKPLTRHPIWCPTKNRGHGSLCRPRGSQLSHHSYVLLDPDPVRRAAAYRLLARSRIVLPLESIEELRAAVPPQAWFLVHDENDLVAQAAKVMVATGLFRPLIAYSETIEPSRIVRAVSDGATHYVEWPSGTDVIENFDEAVVAKARIGFETMAIECSARASLESLTRRENEVLALVCEGKSNKEIARMIQISPRTVEIHRANALTKLGATNSIDATRMFIKAGRPGSGKSAAA